MTERQLTEKWMKDAIKAKRFYSKISRKEPKNSPNKEMARYYQNCVKHYRLKLNLYY